MHLPGRFGPRLAGGLAHVLNSASSLLVSYGKGRIQIIARILDPRNSVFKNGNAYHERGSHERHVLLVPRLVADECAAAGAGS